MPTETAATDPVSALLRPKRSSARRAATYAPEIAAQRVPPSACNTSQSTQSVRSPRASKSVTARSERPISRWISTVRPPCFPREASRSVRSPVEAGSREYSAVSHRRFGCEEPDAAVACRLHGGVRLRRDHADDRNRELLLQVWQRGRRRRVAGRDDELHALLLEVDADLAREHPQLAEGPRTVRQPRVVAEVDEVLVRKGDETLVEDGQAAHARVEDAHRPRVHRPIVTPQYAVQPVFARLVLLISLVLCVGAPPAQAMVDRRAEFTKVDTKVTMSDGAQLAVTFYEPAGTPPAGGWPAVMMFHGLGQTRNSFDLNTWSANRVAETYLVPNGYAVLTFDARAHGESGGLFSLDGPRELQDTRELFSWLTSHPEIDERRVGAFGVSYGGGLVWLAAVNHLPV